jgi:DNA-binding winged helix-turn-helix (wHTH) protein
MQHPKRIFDRATLMNALHLQDVDERTIDAHIVRVRRKIKQLDANAEFIQTIRGLGYIWKQPGWSHDNSRDTSDHIRQRWQDKQAWKTSTSSSSVAAPEAAPPPVG